MTDLAKLTADSAWIPHRIDVAAGRLEFLKLAPEAFRGVQFLADYTPETAQDFAAINLDQLAAMTPAAGPLHFIFHTAFCRSTLLARAMNIEGISTGMSEPGIIVSLVNAGQAGAAYIGPILRLLGRPHGVGPQGGGQAVFVKPTNHANRLLPAMMQAAPQAKAIMMSNSLPAFLKSVNRKGLMGRRWARNLYLEVQAYAPLDLGIDPRENFLLGDMQVAGLAWLLQRRWFAMNLAGPAGERMRSLDSDRFNNDRAGTLQVIADFTGLSLTAEQATSAAQSDVFTKHAKLGGDYTAKEAEAAAKSNSAVFDEEVAMVGQWIGQIAGQAGLGGDLARGL